MSQENVEIARAAFEAWMRGDLEVMLADADPEMEWYVLPEAPDPGPHRGPRAISERVALWREMLELRGEVLEYIDAGEYVVMPIRMRGRPPGGDADVVLDEVYVSKFRDGKVVVTPRIPDQSGGTRSRGAVGARRSRRLLSLCDIACVAERVVSRTMPARVRSGRRRAARLPPPRFQA